MNDKNNENKPGAPTDRHRTATVAVKVDGTEVKIQTVDGNEVDVGDIIKAAGKDPAKFKLGILGKNARYEAGQKIEVKNGMDFSLYEQTPTPVS